MTVTDNRCAIVMTATDIKAVRSEPAWRTAASRRLPMRVFVTGASGWIARAVVPELTAAGHEVVGLARSYASAKALQAAGVEVRSGSLDDLDTLRDVAVSSDGVIHLAF